MSNMSSVISSHNMRLVKPRTTEYGCNYPLQNQCLTPNLIYQADVENNANKCTKIYYGLAETSFKVWFAYHKKDFNHNQYKKAQNCENIYGH